MNTSDPLPHPESTNNHGHGDDPLGAEKQIKKMRVSPPSHTDNDQDAHKQLAKHPSPPLTHPLQQPQASPPSPSSSSSPPRASNDNNNNISNNNRHDSAEASSSSSSSSTSPSSLPTALTTDDSGLYHKRTPKGAKKMKKETTAWGTRLRTHPKPVVRFGTPSQPSSPSSKDDHDDEDGGDGRGGDSDKIMHDPPSSSSSSSPPSSPHPPDDTPLETLLKHGSGWTFPREQNGKMICIFRSCPQPLRGGTKKDYIDHLRLHQTMEHTPLYSMLRNAPPGGLSLTEGSTDIPEESQVSQVDGEWEGDEDEADDGDDVGTGSGGTQAGGASGASGEEELHTPKLSQRGLQLRAQMMRYGLNIFRQDSEGRYLCFFMGCTMRMTTNFSRHIAKHEKKLDAISPDLVHLLKEGVDKPYIKPDKKIKVETQMASSLSLMMPSSAHLIPPPHHSMDPLHRSDGMDLSEAHHSHHLSIEMQREYHSHHTRSLNQPSSHMHMQQSLQHMHIQQTSPPPPGQPLQFMQHIAPHPSKLNLPPPPHPLSHSHPQQAQSMPMPYRHPSHIDNPLHRPPPPPSTSPVGGHSPTNPSEIRWVYRSPLPSPLSLPLSSPRRQSIPYESDTPPQPMSHSPKKPHSSLPHHSFPPLNTSSTRPHTTTLPGMPSPSPSLPRLGSEGDLPFSQSDKTSSSEYQHHPFPHTTSSLDTQLDPTKAPSSPPHSTIRPPPENSDLGAVATSLLDLRKM